MTIYNFSAGPSVLPESALQAAAKAAVDYRDLGMSLMTMSHRSKPVMDMFVETENLVRKLLEVPSHFRVLFLQGGASHQFCMVPMNLLPGQGVADYTDTGEWAGKATKEAKVFGKVQVACTSKESTYNHIPKELRQSDDAVYLHITSNNTIFGTQWKQFPRVLNPQGYLVSDMSSDIFSRPLDWSRFGLVYAGAQKNAGPAGVTLVILREDILGKSGRTIPTILDYTTHIKGESMFNTPPVFSVYVMNETLKWLDSQGGVKAMEAKNERKAQKLYNAIDSSKLFQGTAAKEDRSPMNVPFVLKEELVPASRKEAVEKEFLSFCKSRGLETLAGHRVMGGFRASIYNAMPEAGIDCLVQAMAEFEGKF